MPCLFICSPLFALTKTPYLVTIVRSDERYSDRVRERLWSNRVELHENAQRNAVEFASEGWDWKTVTEDEGMYRCAVSGELIHPVHCQQPYHDHMAAAGGGGHEEFFHS